MLDNLTTTKLVRLKSTLSLLASFPYSLILAFSISIIYFSPTTPSSTMSTSGQEFLYSNLSILAGFQNAAHASRFNHSRYCYKETYTEGIKSWIAITLRCTALNLRNTVHIVLKILDTPLPTMYICFKI